jgi:hypothetical protein
MNWRSRHLRKLVGNSGAAGVEFALVLPFLVIFAFGAIEVGRIMWHHHVVTKSLRDGARFLARDLARASLSCAGGVPSAIPDDYKDRAETLIKTGLVDGTGLLIPEFENASIVYDVSCVAGDEFTPPLRLQFVPVVRITAEMPFDHTFGAIIGDDDVMLRVSQQQAYVGE